MNRIVVLWSLVIGIFLIGAASIVLPLLAVEHFAQVFGQ